MEATISSSFYSLHEVIFMREFADEIKQYLTPANLVIILICIVVFFVDKILIASGTDISDYGAVGWKQVIEDKEFYRILSYMFLHGSLLHLFNNMLVLLFVGSAVEKLLGSGKYLVNYFMSGIIAGVVSVYYNMWRYNHTISATRALVVSVGASGAVFGTVGALLWIVLANKGRIEGISIRRMIMFLVLSFYAGFTATGIDNAAHVGGLFFGFFSSMILYNRRRLRNES